MLSWGEANGLGLVDCLANILKEIVLQHGDLILFCNQNKGAYDDLKKHSQADLRVQMNVRVLRHYDPFWMRIVFLNNLSLDLVVNTNALEASIDSVNSQSALSNRECPMSEITGLISDFVD